MRKKEAFIFVLGLCLLSSTSFAKKLRVAVTELPQTYEPVTATRSVERLVSSLLYDGLIRKTYGDDESGNVVFKYMPVIARDFWPVDELGKRMPAGSISLHWQFMLKPNIFWRRSDGVKTRLTGDDVLYTVNVINNPATKPKDELLHAYLKPAPGSAGKKYPPVEVKNPFMIQINLNHPAYMPQRFLSFPIVKKNSGTTAWNRLKNTRYPYKFNPVGTGPYFLRKRSSRRINFDKNPDYTEWKKYKRQNIDSVLFTKFDDRRSMIKACFFNTEREDAVDIVPELLPDEIVAFEEDNKHYTAELNTYNFYYVGVNFGGSGALSKILASIAKDVKNKKDMRKISLGIREAMLLGLDRESMLKVYGEYPGEVLQGPYLSGVWAYTNQDKKRRRYSQDEAKAILKAIGFEKGVWKNNMDIKLKFRISYKQGDPYYEKITNQFVNSMGYIGIKILPVGVPEAVFDRRIYQERNFDLVLGKYMYREDMDVTQFFSVSNGFLGFQTEQLDEYIAKLRSSQLRRDEIQGLYQAMDRFLWNNLPVIFLWSLNESVGVRKDLQNTVTAQKATSENIRAFDGYNFFGNIARWALK